MAHVTWQFAGSSAPSGTAGNSAYAFDLTLTFAGMAVTGPVTAISGTVTGNPAHRAKFNGAAQITGLSSVNRADNKVVCETNPYVSSDGLSFTDAKGYSYNIFSSGKTIEMYIFNKSGGTVDIGYVTTTVFAPDA
jgi:hypothetical protein